MDGWFYVYHVKFYDDFISAEREETGMIYVETGRAKDACEKICDYYGDDNIYGMSIRPLSEGPCLRQDQIKDINWEVEDFDAKNIL